MGVGALDGRTAHAGESAAGEGASMGPDLADSQRARAEDELGHVLG